MAANAPHGCHVRLYAWVFALSLSLSVFLSRCLQTKVSVNGSNPSCLSSCTFFFSSSSSSSSFSFRRHCHLGASPRHTLFLPAAENGPTLDFVLLSLFVSSFFLFWIAKGSPRGGFREGRAFDERSLKILGDEFDSLDVLWTLAR